MADITVKAYEDKLNPKDAVLVATTDKYTFAFPIRNVEETSKSEEKFDVAKAVAYREKILAVNAAYIASKVSGKETPKEIDSSKLIAASVGTGTGGKG